MYIVLCKKQASPFRQGDEYHMTIAHHWIREGVDSDGLDATWWWCCPPLNQLCYDAGGDNCHLGEVGGRPPIRAAWLRWWQR